MAADDTTAGSDSGFSSLLSGIESLGSTASGLVSAVKGGTASKASASGASNSGAAAAKVPWLYIVIGAAVLLMFGLFMRGGASQK